MDASTHRRTVAEIFDALAEGQRQPFAGAMADDFTWTITGHGPWARTWRGRDEVLRGLMAPLFAQFADTYRNRAVRIVADGDVVVVESRGSVTTHGGRRYDNHYCYVIEMKDGRMQHLTEYMDTALAEAVLQAPA